MEIGTAILIVGLVFVVLASVWGFYYIKAIKEVKNDVLKTLADYESFGESTEDTKTPTFNTVEEFLDDMNRRLKSDGNARKSQNKGS